MDNTYYEHLQNFKELLEDYIDNLFSVYDHELELKLANYNVLSRKDNNIESSTAIGYILEEFIISKLHSFTLQKKNAKFIVYPAPSAHLSYDCYADYEGIRFLINIKSAKGANDAVAAINVLINDYRGTDTLKSFVILKVFYGFTNEGSNRKIKIDNYDTYCLEEVDFSKGHRQDHRRWSNKGGHENSGRLLLSKSFIDNHRMPIEQVSFLTTKEQLELISKKNESPKN